MDYDGLIAVLVPWCRSPAPGMWPSVGVPFRKGSDLQEELRAWAPEGMVPKAGDMLPGTGREWRGVWIEPVRMIEPSVVLELERLGPFDDGSRFDVLSVRFRFGNDSLRLLVEGGRDQLTRTVYILELADIGYEGHARRTEPASADEFADVLWSEIHPRLRATLTDPGVR